MLNYVDRTNTKFIEVVIIHPMKSNCRNDIWNKEKNKFNNTIKKYP